MPMVNGHFLNFFEVVTGVGPSDFNSDQAGDYVSLKNYEGCLVVVQKEAGTAGDDISLQMFQATDVAATAEKALTFSEIWHKIGTQTSVQAWTRVALATATADLDTVSVNGTDLGSDSVAAMFAIDIKASQLDVTNGFDCICFKNDGTDVGNATKAAVLYILYNSRYPDALPKTAIID